MYYHNNFYIQIKRDAYDMYNNITKRWRFMRYKIYNDYVISK